MQVRADVAACASGNSRQHIYVLSNPDMYLSVCPSLYSIIGYNGCHGNARSDQLPANKAVDMPPDAVEDISADHDAEDCPAFQPDLQALLVESPEWIGPAADSSSTEIAFSVKDRPVAATRNKHRLPAKQMTMNSFLLRS